MVVSVDRQVSVGPRQADTEVLSRVTRPVRVVGKGRSSVRLIAPVEDHGGRAREDDPGEARGEAGRDHHLGAHDVGAVVARVRFSNSGFRRGVEYDIAAAKRAGEGKGGQ